MYNSDRKEGEYFKVLWDREKTQTNNFHVFHKGLFINFQNLSLCTLAYNCYWLLLMGYF